MRACFFRLGLLLATVAVLLATGCRARRIHDEAPDVQVELDLEPTPPRVGPARVVVTLTGADGKPVRDVELELEGNMNHAGMKPVFATATEQKPGRYEAELEFTMGGDWFLLLEGQLADGKTLRRKIDVKGVRSR